MMHCTCKLLMAAGFGGLIAAAATLLRYKPEDIAIVAAVTMIVGMICTLKSDEPPRCDGLEVLLPGVI